MRLAFAALTLAALTCAPALAATPDQILAANRAATGGKAWDHKAALAVEYDYAGQGLTGKAWNTTDLKTGAFEQHYSVGPQTGASGYDGTHVWINIEKDGFKVVAVAKGGPAEDAGLKDGDVITQVDGKPFSAIALPDLRLRDDPVGTVVTFRLAGGKDVKITLKDQI